jgi:hypothetical protein
MLDVMEGGPKLRRWYGSDSSVGAPGEERVERKAPSSDVADADARASGSIGFDEATLRAFDAKPRRSVLVAGADTALGEAVVMQLIVAKQDVVVLGIAPELAATRFGPYVTAAPAEMAVDDADAMTAALRRGARCVVCVGKVGALPTAVARDDKVKHVVLVSSAAKGAGVLDGVIGGLFGDEEATRRDRTREDAFAASCVESKTPLTVVRAGKTRASPGGKQPIAFTQSGGEVGELSLEDLAEVTVRCLGAPPKPGDVLTFEAANAPGAAGERRKWKELFASLS